MTAVDTGGRAAWIQPIGRRAGWPVEALDNDELLLVEELATHQPALVVRRQSTGDPVERIPVDVAPRVVMALPGDRVAVVEATAAGATLAMLTRDGGTTWTRAIARRGSTTLSYEEGLLLLDNGDSLQSFDLAGQPRWYARHDGFRDGIAPTLSTESWGTDLSWPLGGGQLLALLDNQLCRIDIGTRAVTPFPGGIHQVHATGDLPGQGRCVIGVSQQLRVLDAQPRWDIVVVRADGSTAWRHSLDVVPNTTIITPDGRVVVWSTLSQDRWDQYHRWQDLTAANFVRTLDAAGSTQWTWYAPGPITQAPIVNPTGEIIVGSAGQLYGFSRADPPAGHPPRPRAPDLTS